MFIKRLSDRGDTVVEVLISLAILTFILTGAYYVSANSVRQEGQAGERTQALELVQGQIEMLKAYYTDGSTPPGSPFCLSTNLFLGTITVKGTPNPIPYNPSTFPVECNVDSVGIGVGTTSGQLFFTLSIQQPSPGLFDVQANWYSQTGSAPGNVTTYYRAQ